jgi:dephospho-CoA kinase
VTVRIGLTGPIGCGKSTVAAWLGERPGVVVIDADRVARDVVEPGEPALDAVVARFGSGVLHADGSLDRPALGRIVFADPAALRDLEAITHPAVRPRILAAIEAAEAVAADAVVIEAIRLVEGGLAQVCDEVWLVTCDPAVQRERLAGRGATADDVERRMAAQAGFTERVRPIATRIIDSSGDASATRALVDAAYAAIG